MHNGFVVIQQPMCDCLLEASKFQKRAVARVEIVQNCQNGSHSKRNVEGEPEVVSVGHVDSTIDIVKVKFVQGLVGSEWPELPETGRRSNSQTASVA